MRKPFFTALFLEVFFQANNLMALQIYPLVDQHKTEVPVSRDQQNRISVAGDRIQQIFGAEEIDGVFLKIQEEFGSFDAYVWRFVDGQPIINRWASLSEVPATTPQSDALSKDLKKRGMTFVGSTIMYAFMQAVGMVNDHTQGCFDGRSKKGYVYLDLRTFQMGSLFLVIRVHLIVPALILHQLRMRTSF